MSSQAAIDKVKAFLAAEAPTEDVVEMDGGYENLPEFLGTFGVNMGDPWLGIQFEAGEEIPITVGADNTTGTYRETGLTFFHIVEPARLSVAGAIRTRAEALRDKLRGQNINGLRVLSVSPPSFSTGATLDFEDGGYISATFRIDFELDINL